MLLLRPLFLLFLPAAVVAAAAAFMPRPQEQWHSRIYIEKENEKEKEEPKKLVLGDGIENDMKRLKSKFPTSEVDFLAAARKRAQEARESINNSASEDDWLNIASQKQSATQQDDWEASLKEAGNEESQILIPVERCSSNADGEDEEPKLLLF
jgi:hypothetical protein